MVLWEAILFIVYGWQELPVILHHCDDKNTKYTLSISTNYTDKIKCVNW